MPPASLIARRFAARYKASRDHRGRPAASASGHGPRPCSLSRSVSQTADAERNLPEVLRELCARRDNYLFVGGAAVLRSTSPPLANRQPARYFLLRSQASRVEAWRPSSPIPRLVGSDFDNAPVLAKYLG